MKLDAARKRGVNCFCTVLREEFVRSSVKMMRYLKSVKKTFSIVKRLLLKLSLRSNWIELFVKSAKSVYLTSALKCLSRIK